jgi:hypothetical protein
MKVAKLTDLNDASLKLIKDGYEHLIKYVCECGTSFDKPVWHCIRCNGHTTTDDGAWHCSNCGHTPWATPSVTRAYRHEKPDTTP